MQTGNFLKKTDPIQVTAAIIEKDGKVLISRRDKDCPLKDKWKFPGRIRCPLL
jgi:hypothetical protein